MHSTDQQKLGNQASTNSLAGAHIKISKRILASLCNKQSLKSQNNKNNLLPLISTIAVDKQVRKKRDKKNSCYFTK